VRVYGPIVWVELAESRGAEFPDLCRACLAEVRKMEQRLKAEDRERKLQAYVQKLSTHSDLRQVRSDIEF
jgi:hypothetical protein